MLDYSAALRRFRETIEPIAASVYFVPEPLQKLGALGLNPVEAYFCGRSAPMGRLEGTAVASLFAFFKPDVAIPAVEGGWKKADPGEVIRERLEGISAYLNRVLGAEPEEPARRAAAALTEVMESVSDAGRPLFAACRGVTLPEGDSNLELWRACDLFREHRGAAHTAAWLVSGLGAREAVVLSKYWWGMESNSYLAVHGWSNDDVREAEEILESQGYIAGGRITDAGSALRDEIEDLTDRMQKNVVDALEGKLDELTESLTSTRDAIAGMGGYPLRRVPSRA